jgi:hypothetical protein
LFLSGAWWHFRWKSLHRQTGLTKKKSKEKCV